MEGPSIRQRALLARTLEKIFFDHDSPNIPASVTVQKINTAIKKTVRVLQVDEEVENAAVTLKDIKSSSILSLCKTLHAVAIQDIDKPKICTEMRRYLQAEEGCTYLPMPAGPSTTRKLQTTPFLKDFDDPNDGVNLVRRFFEHCSTDWHTNGQQYAPSCAIVQSSGSGKSRLMVEIAKTTPTLYICCRASGDSGYPPRTRIIVEHLLFRESMVTEEQVFCRCAALFCVGSLYARVMWRRVARRNNAAVVQVLTDFLNNQLQEDFWLDFVERMAPIEAEIYSRVSEVGVLTPAVSRWQTIEDKAQEVALRYLHTDIYNRQGLSLIVCFDEAGNLGPRREKYSLDLLTQIHRASRLMSEKLGGILVMTDTLCGVPSFGQKKNFPSDRMLQFGTESKIFTSLLTHDVRQHTVTKLKEAVSLYSLAHFGRPIWLAKIKGTRSSRGDWILDFAAAKITGQVDFDARACTDSEELGVALFTARAHLQIVAHTRLTPELVGSYMARLNGVDIVGNSHCGYPADAILALGAAKVLRSRSLYLGHLQKLSLFVQSEHVQKGFRGELLSQILALRAYDELAFEAGTYIGFPVLVRQFLEKFLGAKSYKKMESLNVLNVQNEGILDGFLNLTQFIQVEGYLPTRADLQHFFSRGAAVVCQSNQEGFDLIIPVLLEKGVEEGEPERTKTAGPSHAETISLRKRSLVKRMSSAKEILSEVNDLETNLSNLGTSDEAFVNTQSTPSAIIAEGTVSSDDGDPELIELSPHGKSKTGARYHAPSFQLQEDICLDAHHMSYIVVQCKNMMSSDSRANPDLTPIHPPEKEEETENKAQLTLVGKRSNMGKRSLKGATARPYIVLGMFFSRLEETDVYEIKYKDFKVPRNCLQFVLLNGQYVVGEEGELGKKIASQMTTLLREFSDPANLDKATSMWNRLENAPKYGTITDGEKLRETKEAVERDPGTWREPDSVASTKDPRMRAGKIAPNNATDFAETATVDSPGASTSTSMNTSATPTPIRESRPRRLPAKRSAPAVP